MRYTVETRRESNRETDRLSRYALILDNWVGAMTAREIGKKLGYSDLNAVKPRITELAQMGQLVEAGKKFDTVTRRNVTCWEKAI